MSSDDGEGWQVETEEVESEPDDAADEQWRFSVDEVGDDEEDDQSAVGGNVFGSMDSDTEVIEAGSIDAENALFVVVGVLVSLVVFAEFVLLFT